MDHRILVRGLQFSRNSISQRNVYNDSSVKSVINYDLQCRLNWFNKRFLSPSLPWTNKEAENPLNKCWQGFIQAILMSSRWHKKLNFLIEFSNSIFIKFYFEAYWCWTCIQSKLACKVSYILNYLFVLQM